MPCESLTQQPGAAPKEILQSAALITIWDMIKYVIRGLHISEDMWWEFQNHQSDLGTQV